MAPSNSGGPFSILLLHGRNLAAKVGTFCLDGLRSATSGASQLLRSLQTKSRTIVGQMLKSRTSQSTSTKSVRASVTPSASFSNKPHNKIGFSSAWVCECGHFSVLRSSSHGHAGEVERQCPTCGQAQRLAYVRLLCEPRNDTAGAPGKWVYPEVAVEPAEAGGPAGRDYDWSHYDVIYFQGDRDPDVSSSDLPAQS